MSERPVTLSELRSAMKQRRHVTGSQRLYVLLDENEHVLETFDGRTEAEAELHRRFDVDHAYVERLSLVDVWGGIQGRTLWPSPDSPAERARKLWASWQWPDLRPVEEQPLLDLVRCYWLRGRLIGTTDRLRMVELWWMTADDPRVPVGVLIETSENTWSLTLHDSATRPPAEIVYARLASVLTEYLRDDDWSAADVEGVAAAARRGAAVDSFDAMLARFGLAVAIQLGVLQRTYITMETDG